MKYQGVFVIHSDTTVISVHKFLNQQKSLGGHTVVLFGTEMQGNTLNKCVKFCEDSNLFLRNGEKTLGGYLFYSPSRPIL